MYVLNSLIWVIILRFLYVLRYYIVCYNIYIFDVLIIFLRSWKKNKGNGELSEGF